MGIEFPPRKPSPRVELSSDEPSGRTRTRAPMPSYKAPPGELLDSGPPPSASILDAPTLTSEDESAVEALRAARAAVASTGGTSTEDTSTEDTSTEDTSTEDASIEDASIEDASIEGTETDDSPAETPRAAAKEAEPARTPTPVPDANLDWAHPSESAAPVPIDLYDREDTMVGEIPQGLLALSSGASDDETRAYQAPAELIELAKRQREERRLARDREAQASQSADTVPPPQDPEAESRATRPAPEPSSHPLEDADSGARSDSAAPIALEPYRAVLAGTSRAPAHESNAALSAVRPAGTGAGRVEPPAASSPPTSVVPPTSAIPPTLARFKTPWLSGGRRWAVLAGVMAAVGYAAARFLLS